MKRAVQATVRRAHLWFAKDLPERVGVYFHDLPEAQWSSFETAIGALREAGYEFVGPEELIAAKDQRLAFLSFDDNYRSWHRALSLLDSLDVGATFYVNTLPVRDRAGARDIATYYERIGEDPRRAEPLSTTEIQELAHAGHEIGAHTHSHLSLTSLPPESAHQEITLNRDLLSDFVGRDVMHFSYPFGMRRHFNARLRDFCKQVGFRTVANAIPGLQYAGHHPLSIQRTLWNLERPVQYNLDNIRIDGRLFERLTGRAATPC